jgi:ABC-type polysaccharide/polyol phosphate export permease
VKDGRRPKPVFEAADDRLARSFGDHLRYALRFRTFLGYWVLRNVVTRYRQTTLGPLWALLQPLLSSLVYAFVFGLLLRVDTSPVPYTVFVITNLVLWTYSTRVIVSAPGSVIGNLQVVTRIQFPRECLVLGVWLESLTDLVLGLVVLTAFFLYHGMPLTIHALGALAVFAVHTTFALGVAFLVSAVAIVVRDLLYILPILLQLLLYLVPVVYPLDIVPHALRLPYLSNPLAVVFAAYQETLLFGRFTLYEPLAVSAVTSTAVLALGYTLFKRLEWRLADVL